MFTRYCLKLLSIFFVGLAGSILHPMAVSQAMPVFMELYDADPMAKADYRGKCSICHVSEDSGLRTDFGKAFIKSGYRITPDLRRSFTDLFAQAGESTKTSAAVSGFDTKKFFESNCAMCHGNDGKGVAPATPDFTDAAWHRTNESDDGLAEVIRAGRGIMPPFKDRLKHDEIKVVIAYVRKFAEVGRE